MLFLLLLRGERGGGEQAGERDFHDHESSNEQVIPR